ncbi:MAG: single-stranded DNA-binding protein, partial [Firmicutes bacterium]|nr:single-stranded DNA-binding protein [Bacillota bacterium]
SDYIPCICWGRNAVFADSLNIGDNIKISGRMQSRVYQKKLSETEIIEKTAYEVSVSKIELLNIDENYAEK